jgi:hypothetical protein
MIDVGKDATSSSGGHRCRPLARRTTFIEGQVVFDASAICRRGDRAKEKADG